MERKTNVMKSILLMLFILIIISLLITGYIHKNYSIQENYNAQENSNIQKTYTSLSESQLKQFLAEKNVTSLATRAVENSTIVLYETKLEMGVYNLSVDGNGKISWAQISWENNSNFTPVSIGGTATGVQFVTVIINDDTILKRAYKVTVIFKNNDEITELVNSNKGIIILDKNTQNSNMGWYSVTIFDKDDNILFKKV